MSSSGIYSADLWIIIDKMIWNKWNEIRNKYIHTYLLDNFIFDSERCESEYCKGVEPNQALIDNFCSIF